MRILTVCTSTQVFGAEVITLKLLEGFKQARHEQIAVTTIWTDGEFNRRLTEIGIREVRLPFGFLSKMLAWQPIWWTTKVLAHLPLLWCRWSRLLLEFDPEIVLFTNSRQAVLVYPWLGRHRSYLIEHTYLEPTRFRRFLYPLLARKLVGFVTVSNFMGMHLPCVGAPASRVHVIQNGPLNFRQPDLDQPRGAEVEANTIPRIGIVGQISRKKGYNCLVEAADLLKKRGEDFRIVIFGSGAGDYVRSLQERILALGLQKQFDWMGYESDKENIYGRLDICVVPSCFPDPFPTVAIEASAHAIPLVVSQVGGLPEIVEQGKTGWVVEPNVPEELAGRLQWLLRHPREAEEMGMAGQRKAFAEFTQTRMVSDFEALFKGVV